MADDFSDNDGIAKAIVGLRLDGAGDAVASAPGSGFAHEVGRGEERDQPKPPPAATSSLKPVAKSLPTASNGAKVWDITAKFTQAAAALPVGHLIKDEAFTLFESVGAIEIMDPKMDSGFLADGDSLDDDYNALKPLLPEEVLGIMDQLLCHEMAWHHGYPLAQTLFTSIYIDKLLWPDPKSLDDAQFYRGAKPAPNPLLDVLRAYCVSLVKYCDFVIEKVASRDFYEEEDFSTHTYNRQLLTQTSEDQILAVLDDAARWLALEEESGDHDHEVDSNLRAAITVRLKLRTSLLLVASPSTPLSDAPALWQTIRSSLTKIKDSHDLSRPVPQAFSTKIQRRLASTVPPRPIVEFTFDDCIEKYLQLSYDCEEAVRPADCKVSSPHALMAFVWAFSCRKPEPLAYARACFSSWFMEKSNDEFEAFLRQDLEELVFPEDTVMDPVNWTIEEPRNPRIPKDKRLMMAEIINDFTSKAVPFYYDLWNTLCQNRCRTRRMMCNNIQNWNGLQDAIEPLDEDLLELTSDSLQYALSRWLLHHKLRQIEWIVEIGLEQDVYLPDELTGIYWWLRDISLERVRLLKVFQGFVARRLEGFVRAKQTKKAEKTRRIALYIESLLWEARGTEAIADSLYLTYLQLDNLGLLSPPKRRYADEALRYELRMRPFLAMSLPQIPSFETYQEAVDPERNKDLGLESAERSIKDSKDAWAQYKKLGAAAAQADVVEEAWNKQISSTVLSCVSAGLLIASVREAQRQTDSADIAATYKVELPAPGKRYHGWWIVPKLVKA